jgi:hypothetical protein
MGGVYTLNAERESLLILLVLNDRFGKFLSFVGKHFANENGKH